MEDVISKIINTNKELFGENPIVNKINVGFTNTIYNVNELFIVKICSDYGNEDDFLKEINFYKSNEGNRLIPKLYISNISKDEVPYMYEIIEKIDGVSLYNVWHLLEDSEREDVIKKLCVSMKEIHSNVGESYDWVEYFSKQFVELNNKAKDLSIFSLDEQLKLDYVYSRMSYYLPSTEFVLIHNDLHFDNIFYNNGELKIIDFERSMYAPLDFELDILYRMVRMPWKFASEETEEFTKEEDYKNIMSYLDRYYPEILSIPNLYERLAIYDVIYFLEQLVKHPELNELKKCVLNACELVK